MIPLQSESLAIWQKKYQLKDHSGNPLDQTIDDTFRRVAKALAAVETTPEKQAEWEPKFYQAMLDGAIPAGRILSNAGAGEFKSDTSLINCVVSKNINDSMDGILDGVYRAGMTLKRGSGIGYCFSTLRPKGAYIAGAGAKTSGPLSFMDIYDKMCFSIASAGGRRGAQMATFDVGHPDIEDFIKAKREDGRFRQFNCSVLISDSFMQAVRNNDKWPLAFPMTTHEIERSGINLNDVNQVIWRSWPIHENYLVKDGLVACKIYKIVKATDLWDTIMRSTYEFSEPGVLFVDRINEQNNNGWCENIIASNPCVAKGTLVATEHGWVRVENVKVGDRILTCKNTFSPVASIEQHKRKKVFAVELENGLVVWATAAHIFHTASEEGQIQPCVDRQVKDIKVGDFVFCLTNPTGDGSPPKQTPVRIRSISQRGPETATVYDLYEPTTDSWVTEGGAISRGCGEQVLPPNGACLLGSINLTRFVEHPFTHQSYFDFDKYCNTIAVFTRMLDNVVDINGLPLKEQSDEILSKRRHGMGYMGLGSAMAMLGIRYGSKQSIDFTEHVSRLLAVVGWHQALELAIEKGTAPILTERTRITQSLINKYPDLAEDFRVGDMIENSLLHAQYSRYMKKIAKQDRKLIQDLARVGARFTHHSSIAPTGTLSLSIGNNCSNGIEPSFSHHYQRNVIVEGKKTKEQVSVYSYEQWAYINQHGPDAKPGNECFITADQLTPKEHIDVQAAAQYWVDSSISKTVNVPSDISFEAFKDIYQYAYDQGLKGVATFRFNPEIFQGVLVHQSDLENTTYRFVLDDGSVVDAKGNEQIQYDGEVHTAANLYDAIHDGYYGKL